MGKNLIQQKRGKGSSTYRAHGFRFAGKVSYNAYEKNGEISGEIVEIIHSRGHSAPLMKVKYTNGKEALIPAFEGAFVGKKITVDQKEKVAKEDLVVGNAYMLKNIPEGTSIYNIEVMPGDSGKLVKAGGSFATVVIQQKGFTKIMLPSKKEKLVNNSCRAFVGKIGGGGRDEKPFMKAGFKAMWFKKKNRRYPYISGVAQAAVNHPHGGTRSLRKGRPTIAPHNAPPGRKVGMIRPRHTGRNK